MRLSGWRDAAPHPDAMGPKVLKVIEAVLVALGADADPHAWVVWGENPANRYVVLVPMAPGLLVLHARALVPGEGPRAAAKVTRWSKLQVGELAAETQQGRRLLNFQVEQYVLQGADDQADAIGRFALVLFAAIDGRSWPPFDASAGDQADAP